MIRIAAAADLHFGTDSAGTLRPSLEDLPERADVFLLGGDLTKLGRPEETRVLADELRGLEVPMIGVLGNHDHHVDAADEVTRILEDAGVEILDGTSTVVDVRGTRLGVAGHKGFGGGFPGATGSEFGEREMKAFMQTTRAAAEAVEAALESLDADLRILLLHYAPTRETLEGEPPEIFPFLGSYQFAEVADRQQVDLILHGHAHRGTERGQTPGGTLVRNVAQPVLGRAYALYHLDEHGVSAPAEHATVG